MDLEIRPCRDRDELLSYGEVVRYVFASRDDDEELDRELSFTLPEWTTCAFDNGRVVATMGTFPFTVRLNGAAVPMGGVTAVGTLPEYRRTGLLRRIMTRGFETMHERDQPFAILLASMGAIYQRFGYGLASARVRYEFDPRYVAFESERATPGRVALMERADAFPLMQRVFTEWATPRNLVLHREESMWEMGTFRAGKGQRVHAAVYQDADGAPRGFIAYTTESISSPRPGPDQLMKVRDFVPLDMSAYRALWEFIRRHDLVARVEMNNRVGEDDPAPELLLEPRMLNRSTADWIWMRVVDVARALAARPYGEEGRLVIGTPVDDMCPWNEGPWEFEASREGGVARVTTREPDLMMPVNTLAGLLAGYRSATHYLRAGLLEERTPGAVVTADRVFRANHAPYCPNGF